MVIYANQDTEGSVEELLRTGYGTVKLKGLLQKGKNGARHHHKNRPCMARTTRFRYGCLCFPGRFHELSPWRSITSRRLSCCSSRTISGRLPCRSRVEISPAQSFDVRRRACCSISLPCSRASLLFYWLQARQGLQESVYGMQPPGCFIVFRQFVIFMTA